MTRPRKRILLAMGWYDERVHEGIAQYAIEHGWHLCPDATREKVIPWGWEGDGILAWLGVGDDLAEFVVRASKPTVDFSMRRPGLGFPHVLLDNAAAARLAADDFLARGFTCFLYYSERENWTFEERGAAFVQAINEAGHPCRWACWRRSPNYRKGKEEWALRRKWLARELRQSPKPLAVLAANDDQALEVLETCENSNLSVPEEVAIVGMEDALHAVEAMSTPISSVDTNLEGLGYRGAALLADLMKGAVPPTEPIRVPVVGLITRRSSDAFAVRHPGVARSLRYMQDHYDQTISVSDLARIAGMSLRGFHEAFLQAVGRTPGHELRQTRLQAAKRLLVESDEKISAIAGMCGFRSANGFWSTFRQATGLSPKQYREQKGRRPPCG